MTRTEHPPGSAGRADELERLEEILSLLPEACFVIDADERIRTFSVPPDIRLFLQPEEFLGRRVEEVMPPDFCREALPLIRRVRESGEIGEIDHDLPFPDGVRYFSARVVRIFDDFVLWTARDRTRAHLVAQALAESEARHRSLFENASVGFIVSTLDGTIVDANRLAHETLGYGAGEELKGLSAADIIPADELERQPLVGPRAADGNTIYFLERHYRHRDGGLLPVSITVGPHSDGLVLVAFRDESARRAAEREREAAEERLSRARKVEALATLAGGVAHEFNNALMAIQGNAELALNRLSMGQNATSHLEKIVESCEGAAKTVRRLQNVSRKSREAEGAGPLRVAPLLGEIVRLLRVTAPEGVEVRGIIDAGAPWAVEAGTSALYRIVTRLFDNAVAALGAGGGMIEILLRRAERAEGGQWVEIQVDDNGPGLSPEARRRLFEPFFTTREVGRGEGLGLAEVYRLVTSHGGEIVAHDRPGGGTRMCLRLPEIPADES